MTVIDFIIIIALSVAVSITVTMWFVHIGARIEFEWLERFDDEKRYGFRCIIWKRFHHSYAASFGNSAEELFRIVWAKGDED